MPVHFPAKNKETLGLSPNTSSFWQTTTSDPTWKHACIYAFMVTQRLKEMKEYSTRVHTCNLANIRVHSCIHASTCITRIHVMHVFA